MVFSAAPRLCVRSLGPFLTALSRRNFDDELLADFRDAGIDILAGRHPGHLAFRLLVVRNREEVRHLGWRLLQARLGKRLAAGPGLDFDLVAGLQQHTRDVALAAVHFDVAVNDELAGAVTGRCKAEAVNHIIKAAFENGQQRFAGVGRRPRGEFKVTTELGFHHAVKPFEALLFAQPQAVLGLLASAGAVHTGRRGFAVDRTLRAEAPGTFEEQFHLLAAAPLANRVEKTCHVVVFWPAAN